MSHIKLVSLVGWLFLFSFMPSSKASAAISTSDTTLVSAQVFLSQFELAVLRHDLNGVLAFFDEAYRKEQHDQFLQGNTAQFVKEFFCGNSLKTDEFACLPLNEIIKMKRLSVDVIDEKECAIRYKLKSANRIITIYAAMFRRTYNGELKWGLVGAVG